MQGGEDWYFLAGNQRAIGVADGVGGWAEVGVDAGAYARGVMNNACTVAELDVPTAASTDSSAKQVELLLVNGGTCKRMRTVWLRLVHGNTCSFAVRHE